MKKILLNILIVMAIVLIPSKVFAVELTDDNLRTSLEEMKNYQITNDKGQQENAKLLDSFTLDTTNKQLTLVIESNPYVFNYTLGANPTFTYSEEYTSSLTYDQYKEKVDNVLWMFPYISVLHTQGVDIEDATAYEINILMNILENATNTSLSPSFIIAEEGVEITSSDVDVVRESEFGQYIVNYMKEHYQNETITFNDNLNDFLNSFSVTMKATNSTDSSVTINYKLTIDTTKDFTKLAGLFDKLDASFSDFEETVDKTNKITQLNPTTSSQEIPVPDTALNYPKIIIVVGIIVILMGTVILIKYLKTNKIEEN